MFAVAAGGFGEARRLQCLHDGLVDVPLTSLLIGNDSQVPHRVA